MKIKVDRSALLNAVTPLLGAVGGKNTLAAVEGVLITTKGENEIELTTFDLEKGFVTQIEAKVEESGSYIINAHRFSQIIRTMPEGELTITVDAKKVVSINCGKSKFELSAIDGADFPALPMFRSDIRFTVNQGMLKQMIQRTAFAVAQNENRAALTGAYFIFTEGSLRMVACDGNRLAVRDCICEVKSETENKPEISFILPGKTLNELMKLLKGENDEITVTVTRRNCAFEADGVLFFSRMIEGDYLDYNKFIPSHNRIHAIINTEQFIASLERAFLVTEDRTLGQTKSYVKCTFSEGMLKISSVSVNGRVYDEMFIEGVESELEIGFNCRYLLDALRACGSEKVMCELNTPLSCMVIRPAEKNENEDFLYLVLPIRMKD